MQKIRLASSDGDRKLDPEGPAFFGGSEKVDCVR